MIDFLLCQAEVPESVHQLVETILMEDRTPISNFDWAGFIVSGIIALVVSIWALFVSIWSYKYTKWTYDEQKIVAKNTQLLNSQSQYGIMINLVRHLYRNFVCMLAITNKIRISGYKVYPAEIHLQKAKVSLDDIHLELFKGDEDIYAKLYDLVLQLRNYNLELDAAMAHFMRKDLKPEVKEYDIRTLLLKPGQLADQIVEALAVAYKGEYTLVEIRKDALEKVYASHNGNVKRNEGCEQWDKIGSFVDYTNKDNKFLSTIFKDREDEFFDMLNKDARIECGKNTEGEFKLLFIEFDE